MSDGIPLSKLKGVGAEQISKFAILGLKSVEDLINYYPRRYEDYSIVSSVSKLKPGTVSIKATIKQTKGRYMRRGLHLTEAVASDASDSVRLIWFNQPYRARAIKANEEYYISGQFELSHSRFAIMNPSIELVSDFPVNTARIVPVYRETKGLSSHQIRRALREALPYIRQLPENLPDWLIEGEHLIDFNQAVEAIHFPSSAENLAQAKYRLGFNEVFELSLASLLNKQENDSEQSLAVPFKLSLAKQFVKSLPFKLTDAQRQVVWRIYQDLEKTQPMNRMIEGDVGAGKTVVATMAALMAIEQGYQVALMAPTEILARQHAETVYELLSPLQMNQAVGLLVGSLKKAEKTRIHQAIKASQVKLIIGTQALIQEAVNMHKLALIIIDEQHRFGVEQRKELMAKAGHMPHVLSLTATPIPRSLALTLYGELDISILNQKPAERLPIITKICSPNSRAQLYASIDRQLASGRQMFVVAPLIADSALLEAKSVESLYKTLAEGPYKHRRVGLLHGRLKADQKNQVMKSFINHELDILVATTVIEVGVDIPNASIMLIESAERFGLAQLHQLRGRVGRSAHQGYCYLMTSDSQAPGRRLRALESSSDGFKLAELDLELRGPGAIYGVMQHGQLDLRVANLSDHKLIVAARNAAQKFINSSENLLQYEELATKVTALRAVTNLN